MKAAVKTDAVVIFLYLLLSYPMFYYAYKFGSPDFGNRDFYSYYKLYSNWDFAHVESPFNTRLISSFFIFLFNKIGFFYPAKISYSHTGIDQKVFFNAIFFNYLCLVLTCFSIYRMMLNFYFKKIMAFGMGMLCLLGFGTLFYSLNTLTESFSILLFALVFFAYEQRSIWIVPLFLLSIIQREYIFFIMGLVSAIEYFALKQDRAYRLIVLASSVICFIIYYILRKTVFFTPEYSAQLEVSDFFTKLFHPTWPLKEYLMQSLFNQNIFLLYLLLVGYKFYRKIPFNSINLLIVVALYLQVHFVTLVAELGNSCGRYFYMAVPLLLFYIAGEIKPMLKDELP